MSTSHQHKPCTNLTQAGIISLHQAITDALYRSGATAAQARRRAGVEHWRVPLRLLQAGLWAAEAGG